MARYTGPVCRLCRREGTKLISQGHQVPFRSLPHREAQLPPGQHGKDRKAKIVGYGLQLHEKQKAKRMYFTLEGQFREYYEKANRAQGVTGELLIQQLERRLDNVAFRLGFAISRRQARQVVRHGHVTVNGRKVNIPSYQVNVGDEIAIRDTAKKLLIVEQGAQYAAQNPVPAWLEANFENLSGRICTCPSVSTSTCPSTSS
jgi:small subunit ribosomal protein S4